MISRIKNKLNCGVVKLMKIWLNNSKMNKSKFLPVSLKELNQKLDIEAKRLVLAREEGIVKFVSKKANLLGNSRLVFKNKDSMTVTMFFRLNKDGNLRFAYE